MSLIPPQPRRVLTVEDSATFSAMLKCGIEETHGLTVDAAQTLAEARDYIQAHAHDYFVAIVDLHLPDAPHGEAAHYVVNAGIPTIVFTGSLTSSAETLWELGIADYVHKDSLNSLPYVIWAVGRYLANREIGILVVDDMNTMCQHVAQTLALQHFSVFSTTNAADAFKIVRQQPTIKIAIIDNYLESSNGINLTRELAEQK